MYSLARLYIFVLFCFGLSARLLFYCFLYLFLFRLLNFLFFCLPWMFNAFPWQNMSSSYVCRLLNIVTARRKVSPENYSKQEATNKLRFLPIAEFLWLFARNQNAYVSSWYYIFYFFPSFFLILRQILINAKYSLANATWRLRVITHTDHTCAYANLGLSEMGILYRQPSIVSKAFRFLLNSTMRVCLFVSLLMFVLVTWQAMF